MIIKKLTEGSSKTLYDNLISHGPDLSRYYHHHDREFSSLIDSKNLDLIQNGYYELDNDLFGYDNQIKLETDGSGKFDFENSKKIYEAFKDLTPFDANDERLWVRLTHDHCHKYVVDRWMGGTKKTEKTIIERFFYRGRSQSARVRNGVARLWWIAHLTVVPSEENQTKKWMFTKAICESQDFITSILERTMGTYPNVRFGVLEYYIENKNQFGTSKSKKIQQILRDLNNYGGVSLLPLMSKDEIKNIVAKLM